MRPFDTVSELLSRRAAEQPEGHAYTFLDDDGQTTTSITWGELDRSARRIAAALQSDHGLKAGDRVLLLYPAGLEFIAAFYGCLHAGMVAVPCYPPDPHRMEASLKKLMGIVADCQPGVVLTNAAFKQMAAALLPPGVAEMGPPWVASDALDGGEDRFVAPEITADTLAYLQYTSGTTGVPKGVMVTHRNVIHNQRVWLEQVPADASQRIVSWVPMYHDMGLVGVVVHTLFTGAYCVVMSPLTFLRRPMVWIEAMSRFRATLTCAPNFAFDLAVRKLDPAQLPSLDLSDWRVAASGGEPIRRETLERFTSTFGPAGLRKDVFVPVLGMAETALVVTCGKVDTPTTPLSVDADALQAHRLEPSDAEGALHLVSCGIAPLDHRVIIVDPETRLAVADGQVGEIWIQGDSVARGYWNRGELTDRIFHARLADTEEGPFLRSGDLGVMQDGELFVTGRQKDLVILRGKNHYPQDIERTLEVCHRGLRPGCGVAFSVDGEDGERLVIVHEIKPSVDAADHAAVFAAMRKALADAHQLQAHRIVLVGPRGVPKTSSGKLQRDKTRRLLRAAKIDILGEWTWSAPTAEAADTARRPSARLLEAWICDRVAQAAGVSADAVDADQPFEDAGIDSMGMVELLSDLGKWLDRELSPNVLYAHPTPAMLARFLAAGTAAPAARAEADAATLLPPPVVS